MATTRKGEGLKGRIDLELDPGLPDLNPPDLVMHLLDGDGRSTASIAIDADGGFEIDEKALGEAHRVVIAASGADLDERPELIKWRPQTFQALIAKGTLEIPIGQWGPLLGRRVCVSATIRRCFPFWFVIRDLLQPSVLGPWGRVGPLLPGPRFPWPPIRRCAPICVGTVEVYRRRCCCRPPIIVDPLDPPILIDPPIPIPEPWPPIPERWPPIPPIPPGPGPEFGEAPFEMLEQVLTGGAIDESKLNRHVDAQALRALKGVQLAEFLKLRPYLWCRCGSPGKVADGFVGEGGEIHLCWTEPWRVVGPACHDEYSFVVRQNIGGQTVTIFDGLAANQWFDADDDIELTSYHPRAVACREEPFPLDPGDPFVILQDIGGTESHALRTPMPMTVDSAGQIIDDEVQVVTGEDGLLEVSGGPHALGGDIYLRYHFSESMRTVGAKYCRIQVAPANAATGKATGTWQTINVSSWETWRSLGAGQIEQGLAVLGPDTASPVPDLFKIPYDTGDPLNGNEEWQDGQFHAVFSSALFPHGHYLLRIAVFDNNGVQLVSGAQFSYQRWDAPSTIVNIGPHGSMSHLMWIDNRPVVADIEDITGPGTNTGLCKFFVGQPTDQITISYKAYHPQSANPSFLLGHGLSITRGINDPTPFSPPIPILIPPALGGDIQITLGQLLGSEERCSFAVHLSATAKIHNGSGRLSHLDRNEIAAIAVEIEPPP